MIPQLQGSTQAVLWQALSNGHSLSDWHPTGTGSANNKQIKFINYIQKIAVIQNMLPILISFNLECLVYCMHVFYVDANVFTNKRNT